MDVFAALADPVRRALLVRLAAGPGRVVDLAADHPISRPAVSRHLRVLSSAGVATGEDHGRERYYRLNPAALEPVRDFVDLLSARPPFAEQVLDALELEVRRAVRSPQARPAQPEEEIG